MLDFYLKKVVIENQNYTKVYELRIIERTFSKVCLLAFFTVSILQRYRAFFSSGSEWSLLIGHASGEDQAIPHRFYNLLHKRRAAEKHLPSSVVFLKVKVMFCARITLTT